MRIRSIKPDTWTDTKAPTRYTGSTNQNDPRGGAGNADIPRGPRHQ